MNSAGGSEPEVWSLSDHLANGGAAIVAIRADKRGATSQPVCHHFGEIDPSDPMVESITDKYAPLERSLKAIGVDWAADRIEGWEVVAPDIDWLNRRLPALLGLADQSGLEYLGWTWEPQAGQPVSASPVVVINNRTN